MNKFQFTPKGVQALTTALYALPDEELNVEANLAQNSIKLWLNGHFELSPSQQEYLGNLNESFLDFTSFQLSFALRNRLPIMLQKPETSGLRESKLIETKSNLTDSNLPDGTTEAGGDLTVVINY